MDGSMHEIAWDMRCIEQIIKGISFKFNLIKLNENQNFFLVLRLKKQNDDEM